jgi:hypothetical protein
MEFASATHPRDSRSFFYPSVRIVGNEVRILYRQRTGGVGTTGINYIARDLRYSVEWSSRMTPGQWQTGELAVEEVPASALENGDGTQTVSVRSLTPVIGNPTQFFRLKVEVLVP